MVKSTTALGTGWLAGHFTIASALPAELIFQRAASTCSAEDFIPCTNARFPADFCCPKDSKCLALAGGTTLLCCPQGSECAKIMPIPCDISLQDAAKNPSAEIKTSALRAEMDTCGQGTCCPFGYTCGQEGTCRESSTQDLAPSQQPLLPATALASPAQLKSTSTTQAATSATMKPSVASTSTASSQTAGATALTPTPAKNSIPNRSHRTSGGTVAGTILGVLVGLSLIGVLIWYVFKRRNIAAPGSFTSQKNGRLTSSHGNIISAPIPQGSMSQRSDFARKPPVFDLESESDTASILHLVNGIGTPQAQKAKGRSLTIIKPRGGKFVEELMTPLTHRGRMPSSQSIDVYTDPHVARPTPERGNGEERQSRMTTLTGMMMQAGLSSGRPYVPARARGQTPTR